MSFGPCAIATSWELGLATDLHGILPPKKNYSTVYSYHMVLKERGVDFGSVSSQILVLLR